MRELIVVRHGEGEGNARGLAQGRLPYPLTERGRRQASAAGHLARALSWEPARIVTSPVRRCAETAAILAHELGLPEPRDDEAFTEIDCGSATGRPFADLERDHPEFFGRPPSEWLGFGELGGESDEQLLARVARGLDALPTEESLLLVTHGAVLKATLVHMLGFPARFRLGMRCGTCMRLERRTGDVVALTHLLHAEEMAGSF